MKPFLLAALAAALTLSSCTQAPPAPRAEEPKPSGPTLVEMKTEAQEHVGLELQAAARTKLAEFLQATGSVQPTDSRVSPVHPLSRGRVMEVLAKVGDRVAAGQPLARIDNIEAAELFSEQDAAQAELQRLNVRLATLNRQLERNRNLVEVGATARKVLELNQAEIEEMQQNIRAQESVIRGIVAKLRRSGVDNPANRDATTLTLSAPFAGVITKTQTAPGQLVEPTEELFTVADISQVWVQAEVYEKDLGRIRVGQTAFISVDTYPDETFTGRVSYISDILDPQTRTARVRCELANPNLKLKLDMFASIRVPTTLNREALTVPVGAVQQLDNGSVVFVQKDPTHFEVRPITTGSTVDGQAEVLSGLRAGERIVSKGAFHLKSIIAGKELGEE